MASISPIMYSSERPTKRSITSASVSGQPSSASTRTSIRTLIRSLSTSTPSQSKITRSQGTKARTLPIRVATLLTAAPSRRCGSEDAASSRPRARTATLAVRRRVVALFLGFTAVWMLAWLLFGLGACGEDSDITAADYERCAARRPDLPQSDGHVAATVVTAGLAAAVRGRAVRPVLILTAVLTLAGAASLAATALTTTSRPWAARAEEPAATYSPRPVKAKYHRRCGA